MPIFLIINRLCSDLLSLLLIPHLPGAGYDRIVSYRRFAPGPGLALFWPYSDPVLILLPQAQAQAKPKPRGELRTSLSCGRVHRSLVHVSHNIRALRHSIHPTTLPYTSPQLLQQLRPLLSSLTQHGGGVPPCRTLRDDSIGVQVARQYRPAHAQPRQVLPDRRPDRDEPHGSYTGVEGMNRQRLQPTFALDADHEARETLPRSPSWACQLRCCRRGRCRD